MSHKHVWEILERFTITDNDVSTIVSYISLLRYFNMKSIFYHAPGNDRTTVVVNTTSQVSVGAGIVDGMRSVRIGLG